MTVLRQRLFTNVASLSPMLPAFRGRTRLFLSLFNALNLRNEHTHVDVTLREPVAYRAHLDLHSWLQRLAYLTGSYEPDTVRYLARFGSGYLLDIGANVGLISIPFAKLTGRPVYAFEAVPSNHEALKRNIALNNLVGTLKTFPVALGDEHKTVEIQVEGDLADGEGTGTANILADDSNWNCARFQLQVLPLDSLDLPRGCSIIKIDTDGYDLKVLQGARNFLTKNRPVIYGEFAYKCLAWHGQSIEDVRSFAASLNYEVRARVGSSWEFTPEFDPALFTQDALLVPKEINT